MERTYKEKITELLRTIDDEKFLRYLYILVSEMTARGKTV
jgi:hypothetical protein